VWQTVHKVRQQYVVFCTVLKLRKTECRNILENLQIICTHYCSSKQFYGSASIDRETEFSRLNRHSSVIKNKHCYTVRLNLNWIMTGLFHLAQHNAVPWFFNWSFIICTTGRQHEEYIISFIFKKKMFAEEITYSGSVEFLQQPGRRPLCHAT